RSSDLRFACDWHRLPGTIPGQPQTQTGVAPSVTPGREGLGKGPCRNEQPDSTYPRRAQDPRALARRGARGQHVVHQEDACGRRASAREPERPSHGEAPIRPRPPGLRRTVGARGEGLLGRPAAPFTCRRKERDQRAAALRAERPAAPAASRAPFRIEEIEQRSEHAWTLERGNDTPLRATTGVER